MRAAKIEYDEEVDAAYLYLKHPIKEGEAENAVEINEDITLDFDKKGKLLGVEILNATKNLKDKTLLASQKA